MKRNISETPERWVILKIPNNYYKVFGTWAGGYLDGDQRNDIAVSSKDALSELLKTYA